MMKEQQKNMDATLKSLPLEKQNAIDIINDILSVELDDEIKFEIESVRDTRQGDEYDGFKIGILAEMSTIRHHLAIELTTRDIILLDVNVPDIDRFKICKHIKNYISYLIEDNGIMLLSGILLIISSKSKNQIISLIISTLVMLLPSFLNMSKTNRLF